MPKIKALKIDAARDETSEMGPLITQQQLAKVRGYSDKGEAEGAKVL